MEIWKPISDLPAYSVSNMGRVMRIDPVPTGSTWPGKIMALNDSKGYNYVCLYANNKRYRRAVHRLVAEAFIPNPLNLPEVNHKYGITKDNRDTELEWASRIDNHFHALKTGLRKTYGVRYDPRRNNWQAYIGVAGKFKHLGCFATEQEAIIARKAAEENNWGRGHGTA